MRRPSIRILHRGFRVAGVAGVALAVGACPKVPTQSASMQATPGLIASASQLQLQAFEMGRHLSTIIERTADTILALSSDPTVRRNALLWKISAIPLVQEAALRTEPHVAAVDLWAFTVQQQDYFSTGNGRASFGAQQPMALSAADAMDRDTRDLVARSMRGGELPSPGGARVTAWAAAHPMQGPALRRASVLDSDWQALGLSDNSLTATLGSVDRTMVNITFRLSYLNETLAAEVRWNAELAAEQALRTPPFDSLVGNGTATLRSVGTLAADAPALIDRERVAMMRDVDRQRVAMMLEVDRQRVETLRDLAAQRVALEALLTAERQAILAQVTEERKAALLAADSVAQRAISRSGSMLRTLVVELTLAALLLLATLLASGLYLVKRARR